MRLSTAWRKWRTWVKLGGTAAVNMLAGVVPAVGANWIDNGNGSFTHTTGGAVGQVSWSGMALVAGATYRATYTISGITAGSARVRIGTTVDGTLRNANGTYTDDLVVPAGVGSFRLVAATTNFDGTFSAITLIRIS